MQAVRKDPDFAFGERLPVIKGIRSEARGAIQTIRQGGDLGAAGAEAEALRLEALRNQRRVSGRASTILTGGSGVGLVGGTATGTIVGAG